MNCTNSLFVLFFSFSFNLFAQVTFHKTYGGTGFDASYSTIQTSDEGFVLAGVTESYSSAVADAYLVKTDSQGNVLWSRTFGGSGVSHANSVKQTMDGGFIITGNTSFGAAGNNVYLLKADAVGMLQWSRTFGDTSGQVGYSVLQSADGGYVVAGYTYNPGNSYGVYLVKTDPLGNFQWSKVYGGTNDDRGYEVKQTSDGGYIVVGYTMSFGAGTEDVYLIKTDGNGNLQWSRTYGGYSHDFGTGIEQTSDGGYIMIGYSPNFGWGAHEVYIIRTDVNGDTLWTKVYGDNGSVLGMDIEKTLDGGYVASFNDWQFNGRDMYLMKINAVGDTLWTRMYGDTAYQNPGASVVATADGGYLVGGKTNNFGSGTYGDAYLVKTDSDGNSGCYTESAASKFDAFSGVTSTNTQVGNPNTVSFSGATDFAPPTVSSSGVSVQTICLSNGVAENNLPQNEIDIYPSPSEGIFTIQTEKFIIRNVEVFSILGEKIFFSKPNSGVVEINLDRQPNGVYFCKVILDNGGVAVGKVIIQ